jgi:putative DNA primase/helicase
VQEATEALCHENSFDPEKDWLNGLVWDGVPRLDTWIIDCLKAKDTKLNRAIGRKIIIAKVRRTLYPGCPHDWVAAFEAPQGKGKSTFAKALAGDDDKFLDAPIMHKDTQAELWRKVGDDGVI